MDLSATIQWVPVFIMLAGFAVTVGGAAVWLRAQIGKQRNEELGNLVETRGEKIKDLESEVRALSRRVDEWEGKYKNLVELFESDIAERIAGRIEDHINERMA